MHKLCFALYVVEFSSCLVEGKSFSYIHLCVCVHLSAHHQKTSGKDAETERKMITEFQVTAEASVREDLDFILFVWCLSNV